MENGNKPFIYDLLFENTGIILAKIINNTNSSK